MDVKGTPEAPHCLLEAVMEKYEVTEATAKEMIGKMDLEQRLEAYLSWNGILGFTGQIMAVVESAAPALILTALRENRLAVNEAGDIVLRH